MFQRLTAEQLAKYREDATTRASETVAAMTGCKVGTPISHHGPTYELLDALEAAYAEIDRMVKAWPNMPSAVDTAPVPTDGVLLNWQPAVATLAELMALPGEQNDARWCEEGCDAYWFNDGRWRLAFRLPTRAGEGLTR